MASSYGRLKNIYCCVRPKWFRNRAYRPLPFKGLYQKVLLKL